MNSDFYKAFENRHRGSRDLIKSRLHVYSPFIKPLLEKKQAATPKALDLGCGRGEWLEFITEQGFIAQGVDLDEGMLEACWERDLKAEKIDALDYLQALKANSIAIISGFHIAEHIAFEKLEELVEQALRVLKSGGLLILETPNPENIVVGTANFYLDPTHQRPLPPQLLSFVAEHAGFERVKVLRLQEPEGLLKSQNISLLDVLSGVSPDYSIIAQKSASKGTLKKFDTAFSRDYGVTLQDVANTYEEQSKRKAEDLRISIDTEHQRAVQLSTELNTAKLQLEQNIQRMDEYAETVRNENAEFKREYKTKLDAEQQLTAQLSTELSTAREDKAAAEAVRLQLEQNIQRMDEYAETIRNENAEVKREYKTKLDAEQQLTAQLSTELSTAREDKAAAEAVRLQLEQNIQRMDEYAYTLSQKNAQFEREHIAKLDSEQQLIAQLSKELSISREDKAAVEAIRLQLEQNIQHMNKHAQWLQHEWDEAKLKIDELNQTSHHWWLETDRLNNELQSVYKSKSWRFTWPLRKLTHFLKWLILLPIRIILWAIRLPKRFTYWFFSKIIAYTLKRPNLKKRVMAKLHGHPKVEANLRQFAQSHGIVAQPMTTFLTEQLEPGLGRDLKVSKNEDQDDVDLSDLTLNAKHIYRKLKKAKQQHKESY